MTCKRCTAPSAWLAFAVALLIATALGAAPLPEAKPEDVGMSSERLARLTAVFTKAVEAGDMPGVVLMIARNGKLVYQKSIGMQDQSKSTPMAMDSIFRIYSMTKPIVSVAAMILVEEGKLTLAEPISKYIPEFKDMTVGVETFNAAMGTSSFATVPAKRQITVQDLLRHTSGLTYGVFVPKTQIGKMYTEANLWQQKTIEDFCKALARIPLRNEPGTVWEYSHSTDVLGRVVEVAAGQPLDQFVAERVLKPLKMNDTGWDVPAEKQNRIAEPKAGGDKDWDPTIMLDPRKKATLFAGGHGLMSTAGDYLRFAQMLVNGGVLDGARILSRTTVAYMASNHVTPEISKGPNFLPGPGYGFGLGFGVRLERGMSDWMGTPGEFYWGGYAGTAFWVDPKEQLVPVLMMQAPGKRAHYRTILRDGVYQAIVD
jgi:CubicO group peptidase (beta-lactamase class C family)